mmetsp:Transcript_17378/g.48239  ORF Transcript_17378/g.48239 Transcript_17378/m.48239 type:complete len:201 (+) Transcript_17378:101-703(+)
MGAGGNWQSSGSLLLLLLPRRQGHKVSTAIPHCCAASAAVIASNAKVATAITHCWTASSSGIATADTAHTPALVCSRAVVKLRGVCVSIADVRMGLLPHTPSFGPMLCFFVLLLVIALLIGNICPCAACPLCRGNISTGLDLRTDVSAVLPQISAYGQAEQELHQLAQACHPAICACFPCWQLHSAALLPSHHFPHLVVH